ncbi:hypothetical protein AB0C68_19165 [Streptomyces tendae]|uniref:hypothetical protein n=1 Tax=Streptomyces TaxID=1883 RepID=UPI000D1B545F|nr:hypothetical protein [Streptomyces sp. CS113]
MVASAYSRERLEEAVGAARNWTDLMRRLGLKVSGGQRRVLQEKVNGYGLDTSHFVKRSPSYRGGNGDQRAGRRT